MNQPTYSQFVATLAKPGEDILKTLTPEKCDLWHHATGVSGEAGELLDAVKKHVIYNKPIDRENIVEEVGDALWYLQGIKNNLRISDEEIETYNRTKLAGRYNSLVYSDKAAQDRADKAPTTPSSQWNEFILNGLLFRTERTVIDYYDICGFCDIQYSSNPSITYSYKKMSGSDSGIVDKNTRLPISSNLTITCTLTGDA